MGINPPTNTPNDANVPDMMASELGPLDDIIPDTRSDPNFEIAPPKFEKVDPMEFSTARALDVVDFTIDDVWDWVCCVVL
jgi:hypothetical protein